jgi:hypothetical protein
LGAGAVSFSTHRLQEIEHPAAAFESKSADGKHWGWHNLCPACRHQAQKTAGAAP